MRTLLFVMKLVPVVIVNRLFTLIVLVLVVLFGLGSLCSTLSFMIVLASGCMVIVFPRVITEGGVYFVAAQSWCRSGRRLGRGTFMIVNVKRRILVVIVV
jgi:hypothetical protein